MRLNPQAIFTFLNISPHYSEFGEYEVSVESMLILACLLICYIWTKLEHQKKSIALTPNFNATFLQETFNNSISSDFICPITQVIMQDPVRIENCDPKHVFERKALEKWIKEARKTNPLTNEELPHVIRLIPATDVQEKINSWMKATHLEWKRDFSLAHRFFAQWSHGKVSSTSQEAMEKRLLEIRSIKEPEEREEENNNEDTDSLFEESLRMGLYM